MRLSKPTLRNSFFGWFIPSAAQPEPDPVEKTDRLQNLRSRMIDELMNQPESGSALLVLRIQDTDDAQSLWFYRSHVMQALGRSRGEFEARAFVDDLAPLFKDLLPPSLAAAEVRAPRH